MDIRSLQEWHESVSGRYKRLSQNAYEYHDRGAKL